MNCLIVINGCLGVFGKIKGGIEMKMSKVVKYLELIELVKKLNEEMIKVEVEVDREENSIEEINYFYDERKEILGYIGLMIYDYNVSGIVLKSILWEWLWENDEGGIEKREWKYLRCCWKKFLDECEKREFVK